MHMTQSVQFSTLWYQVVVLWCCGWTLPHTAAIMIVLCFFDAHHNNFCVYNIDVNKSTALQAYFRLFYQWQRKWYPRENVSITDTVFGGGKKKVSILYQWYKIDTIKLPLLIPCFDTNRHFLPATRKWYSKFGMIRTTLSNRANVA